MQILYFLIAITIFLVEVWPIIVIGIAIYVAIALVNKIMSSMTGSRSNNASNIDTNSEYVDPKIDFNSPNKECEIDEYSITVDDDNINATTIDAKEILDVSQKISEVNLVNEIDTEVSRIYEEPNIVSEIKHSYKHITLSEDANGKVIHLIEGLTNRLPEIIECVTINAIHQEECYQKLGQHSSATYSPEDVGQSKEIDSGLYPLLQILNLLMVNAIRREKEATFYEVPYWEDKYIYSPDDLDSANTQQKKFYKLFKNKFLEGHYLDISENWNYAFVLMFDLADAYMKHRDYELLNNQLHKLAEKYPIVENYIDNTLRKMVLTVKQKDAEKNLQSYDKSKGQLCRWITSDEIIDVQGIKLTRGNFYIGECFLLPHYIIKENYEYMWEGKSPYIYGPVMNPNLPVCKSGHPCNVFCSYNDMAPNWRYEYLLWLSNQKTISETPTEIILFYLYGCEIRMFVDPETEMSEREKMLFDITNLYEFVILDTERKNGRELLYYLSEFVVCSIIKFFPTKFEDKHLLNLLKDNTTYQRHYIARRLPSNGKLSAIDAFEIAKSLYDIEQIVPMEYLSFAEEYFVELFPTEYKICYYCNGVKDKENKNICYYNNNGCFNSERVYLYYELELIPNEVWNIREAIIGCYWNIHSRFRNYNNIRKRTDSKTIAAIFLLPNKINVLEIPKVQTLVTRIKREMQSATYIVKPISWLLKLWEYERKEDKSIHIEYADSIIDGLNKMGFDIVPNYKVGEKRFDFNDLCVIFRNQKNLTSESTLDYKLSELFIKLAAQVILSDHVYDSDYDFVEQFFKHLPSLKEGNILHLKAFARWTFMSKKRRLDKSAIETIKILTDDDRALIGKELIILSCSNGDIHPKRIDSLKKVLTLLGLESGNIHTQIHQLLTDGEGFAVVEKKTDAVEYEIGKGQLSIRSNNQPRIVIDSTKLSKLEVQTQEAQAILSDIFVEEDSENTQRVTSSNTLSEWKNLLEILLTKEVWQREDVEILCKERGLMLGASLEQINDYAYGIVNDAVVEDDSTNIYVTLEYKNELI